MSLLWLSRDDVRQAGGGAPEAAVPLIESALLAHAAGASCQPLKPYLKIPNDAKARRIIAMPAYLGNDFQTWGLKWIASAPDNPTQRGIERASALIILNDVETGQPIAVMEGALISAARTAAVALIAAKHLAPSAPQTLACLGNGMIGSLITHSLLNAFPSLTHVHLFDHLTAKAEALKTDLEGSNPVTCTVAENPRDALSNANLVLTATTATNGYIEGEWLGAGTLFLNVSLRDPTFSVVERADKLVVDEWEQVNRSNTIIHRMTQAGRLTRNDLHAELPGLIAGRVPGREDDDEIILFCPMGLPIYDIATAWGVYQEAQRRGLGVALDMYEAPVPR